MTIDVSLIPQNRVENLISKLSEIENNIGNIGTDITNNVVHKNGNETITGEKTFQNNITAPNQIDYTNISNCITYIPQDIKLELNNGTLTLKAGSKLYVPNRFESDGTTKKFDVVITDRDVSIPKWNNSVPGLISITSNREIWIALLEQQYSGGSAPTSQLALWYDTTNNIIKSSSNSGSTWKEGYCLPIAICTSDSSKWTSIDQVFNGFGYIGSTVYALPGVKGLIPNSRNADGSLKNIEFVNDRVLSYEQAGTFSNFDVLLVAKKAISGYYVNLDTQNNVLIGQGGEIYKDRFVVGKASVESGNITSFTPKTVFHALDYNDKSTISGWSMPSSRYIDLTLGASGSTYTAPANGYVYLSKVCTANGQWAYIQSRITVGGFQGLNTFGYKLFAPVAKGARFIIDYNLGGKVEDFRFIYAEGEN